MTISDNNAGYTHASSYDTLTIDSSALSGVSTIDLSAEVDAKVVLTTGAAADVLTSSKSANFGDSITSGAGNDTITIHNGHLTPLTQLTAAGTDVLTNSDATTLLDAAFDNVSNFETITGGLTLHS